MTTAEILEKIAEVIHDFECPGPEPDGPFIFEEDDDC